MRKGKKTTSPFYLRETSRSWWTWTTATFWGEVGCRKKPKCVQNKGRSWQFDCGKCVDPERTEVPDVLPAFLSELRSERGEQQTEEEHLSTPTNSQTGSDAERRRDPETQSVVGSNSALVFSSQWENTIKLRPGTDRRPVRGVPLFPLPGQALATL